MNGENPTMNGPEHVTLISASIGGGTTRHVFVYEVDDNLVVSEGDRTASNIILRMTS